MLHRDAPNNEARRIAGSPQDAAPAAAPGDAARRGRAGFVIKVAALVVMSAVLFFVVFFDASHYDADIARVTDIRRAGRVQTITAVLVNGSAKGTEITLTNKYHASQVYDEVYHRGNYLFVKETGSAAASSSWTITGVKRDYLLVGAVLLLFDLLILVTGREGVLTIVGLAANVLIYLFALEQYTKGRNVLVMCALATVVSACVILFLINGVNRVSLVSVASTLLTAAAVCAAAAAALALSKPVQYEFMDFLPEPYSQHEADLVLLSEVLVGCLGAVIDISVIMTSSALEIRRRRPDIPEKDLFLSCRSVADDITGTMINIMLLTNIAAFLPVFVVAIQNGFEITTIIKTQLFFEMIRFLTGSIGIVLAIPISIFTASRFTRSAHAPEEGGRA